MLPGAETAGIVTALEGWPPKVALSKERKLIPLKLFMAAETDLSV